MIRWFRGFSEIPGIEYKSKSLVHHPELPKHFALLQPELHEIANIQRQYLFWPMLFGTGTTSSSPAKQWTMQVQDGKTTAQMRVRQLYEALELPGELLDYHFAIQGCCSELWRVRREEPWLLAELEELCWLDIRLIQAYPDIIRVKNESTFLSVTTLHHLIVLYEQEGYLYDALQVAEIATTFNQQTPALKRIQSRITRLESEEVN